MKKLVLVFIQCLMGISGILGLLTGYLFYRSFRLEYNGLGRHFDGAAITHEGASIVYFILLSCAIISLILFAKVAKHIRLSFVLN